MDSDAPSPTLKRPRTPEKAEGRVLRQRTRVNYWLAASSPGSDEDGGAAASAGAAEMGDATSMYTPSDEESAGDERERGGGKAEEEEEEKGEVAAVAAMHHHNGRDARDARDTRNAMWRARRVERERALDIQSHGYDTVMSVARRSDPSKRVTLPYSLTRAIFAMAGNDAMDAPTWQEYVRTAGKHRALAVAVTAGHVGHVKAVLRHFRERDGGSGNPWSLANQRRGAEDAVCHRANVLSAVMVVNCGVYNVWSVPPLPRTRYTTPAHTVRVGCEGKDEWNDKWWDYAAGLPGSSHEEHVTGLTGQEAFTVPSMSGVALARLMHALWMRAVVEQTREDAVTRLTQAAAVLSCLLAWRGGRVDVTALAIHHMCGMPCRALGALMQRRVFGADYYAEMAECSWPGMYLGRKYPINLSEVLAAADRLPCARTAATLTFVATYFHCERAVTRLRRAHLCHDHMRDAALRKYLYTGAMTHRTMYRFHGVFALHACLAVAIAQRDGAVVKDLLTSPVFSAQNKAYWDVRLQARLHQIVATDAVECLRPLLTRMGPNMVSTVAPSSPLRVAIRAGAVQCVLALLGERPRNLRRAAYRGEIMKAVAATENARMKCVVEEFVCAANV